MANLQKIDKILSYELKLIQIKTWRKIIFVGDTHGDLEASQKIVKEYLKEKNIVVFLGDYVDRGLKSRENLDFLLEKKAGCPSQIYLLQGNHEGYRYLQFSPADFWESLTDKELENYQNIVEKFPLVFSTDELMALHGALPDLESLEAVNKIKIGDKFWYQITWGDFVETTGETLGIDPLIGRPVFGRDWFLKLMKRFKKTMLIRSHDPTAPLWMFDKKCLTILTSSAYPKERLIVIADFQRFKTTHQLEIRRI